MPQHVSHVVSPFRSTPSQVWVGFSHGPASVDGGTVPASSRSSRSMLPANSSQSRIAMSTVSPGGNVWSFPPPLFRIVVRMRLWCLSLSALVSVELAFIFSIASVVMILCSIPSMRSSEPSANQSCCTLHRQRSSPYTLRYTRSVTRWPSIVATHSSHVSPEFMCVRISFTSVATNARSLSLCVISE